MKTGQEADVDVIGAGPGFESLQLRAWQRQLTQASSAPGLRPTRLARRAGAARAALAALLAGERERDQARDSAPATSEPEDFLRVASGLRDRVETVGERLGHGEAIVTHPVWGELRSRSGSSRTAAELEVALASAYHFELEIVEPPEDPARFCELLSPLLAPTAAQAVVALAKPKQALFRAIPQTAVSISHELEVLELRVTSFPRRHDASQSEIRSWHRWVRVIVVGNGLVICWGEPIALEGVVAPPPDSLAFPLMVRNHVYANQIKTTDGRSREARLFQDLLAHMEWTADAAADTLTLWERKFFDFVPKPEARVELASLRNELVLLGKCGNQLPRGLSSS